MATRPLVVIVGPTASGKTSLAIALAKKFDGEIVCADSRTVYKGMDIGTAKPTRYEQEIVPHWGLDLVDPGQRFSAADFKEYANAKINDIRQRGKTPFLVGGTGLYVDGVLFDYQYSNVYDKEARKEYEKLSIDQLINYCIKHNIQIPENSRNKRYVIRAIEQNGINNNRKVEPISNTIIVGIATEREELRTRIQQRSEQLFEDKVVEEATLLGKNYGWNSEAMTGNIYPLVHRYINNEISLDQLKEMFITMDWRLAKRQLTWLKRNKFIKWLSLSDANKYLSHELENWLKS